MPYCESMLDSLAVTKVRIDSHVKPPISAVSHLALIATDAYYLGPQSWRPESGVQCRLTRSDTPADASAQIWMRTSSAEYRISSSEGC